MVLMKQLQKEENENMHHVQNTQWNFVDKANGLSPRETVEYSGKNRPARGRTNGVWVPNGSIAGSQIHALVGDGFPVPAAKSSIIASVSANP